MNRILYIGWLGFQNLGDELMWLLFRDLCRVWLPAQHYDVVPSLPGVDLYNLDAYNTVILGGGSLLIPGYSSVAQQAVLKGKKLIIWGTGHDREKLPIFGPDGLALSDLTFSSDDQADNDIVKKAVEGAVWCGVRGPLTAHYLNQIGVAPGKAFVSGDPGMLLPSPTQKEGISGPPTIGVNWGTAYNRIYGGNEEAVETQLIEALNHLMQDGYNIHIFPVWGPDREACQRLYHRLGHPGKVTLDLELLSHQDRIEQMKNWSATINFKLHASYLSMAAGVPFICLGYRFKALDFGFSIGLQEFVVPTHEMKLADTLLDRIGRAEQEREVILEAFRIYREMYRGRLEEPFRAGLI